MASNSNIIRGPLWTIKGLGAKRNQGRDKVGLEKFEHYCKVVEKNRAMVTLKNVDIRYWKYKQSEINKDEERK